MVTSSWFVKSKYSLMARKMGENISWLERGRSVAQKFLSVAHPAHHVAHPVGQTLVHVSNTLLCPPCPRHRVRNSVVLVMPTAVLVDSVILSQPLPAPSPFVELCLSEGVRHLCLPPLNPGRCRPHPAVPPQTVTPSRARFHDLRHVCVCLFACISVRMHSFVLLLLHA